MDDFGPVIREGRWLYDGTGEVAVRIRQSDTRFGSGDHDDPPEVRDDHQVRCHYVDWDGAGTNRSAFITGPFDSLREAEEFAVGQSRGTLSWIA